MNRTSLSAAISPVTVKALKRTSRHEFKGLWPWHELCFCRSTEAGACRGLSGGRHVEAVASTRSLASSLRPSVAARLRSSMGPRGPDRLRGARGTATPSDDCAASGPVTAEPLAYDLNVSPELALTATTLFWVDRGDSISDSDPRGVTGRRHSRDPLHGIPRPDRGHRRPGDRRNEPVLCPGDAQGEQPERCLRGLHLRAQVDPGRRRQVHAARQAQHRRSRACRRSWLRLRVGRGRLSSGSPRAVGSSPPWAAAAGD